MDTSIHWFDGLIIVVYLSLMLGMGLYFARRQTNTDRYFIAGKTLPSWAIGLSILATLISSVTFIAYPGQGFASNWILLVQGLMVPVVLIFLVWFIVPLFRGAIGLSAYEYFEKRFGIFARIYASLAFAMAHFSKMGTVFFLLALVLSSMLGVDITLLIIFLGIAVVVYTLIGGIEAVVWSDVIQGILLLAGGLVCIFVLFFTLPIGGGELVRVAWEAGKIDFGPYDWDLAKLTFIVMVLNGFFYGIHKYGTDQTIVQRYLAARSDRDAIRASLVGVFLCVPVWALFMFIGSLLYGYYTSSVAELPPDTRADAVFPYFIMTELPIGITGIIFAGLIAAAFSSLDSDLNSLAAVSVEDYYKRFGNNVDDRAALRFSRIMVVIFGAASIAIAMYYVHADNETILAIIFTFYAIFSGGIAGLFLLGVCTRRANKQGLYVGIVATVLFTGWALLTSTPLVPGSDPVLDLGRFNYGHHSYMLGVYSHLVLFGVGYTASLFFKSEDPAANLTIHAWLAKRRGRAAE
ncbi:MAG: sodium:solute symporter [Opitutales bacterium]|nr:sodium:solute symporter [Opitutales bacterium]